MNLKLKYKSLDDALKYFRKQVSIGIPWALEELPALDSPRAVFDYLQPRTKYKNDPKGVELFQKIQTLLTTDNYHGIVGAGDCDCFTIAALSTLLANGFTDCGIVLAGRSPLYPVHIWAYCNYNGSHYNLDLTCKRFDQTRYYPITQEIKYKINPKEKQMILQLAEGESGLEPTKRPRYIYLANKGINVREDYYDHLSAGQFQTMCLSEGVSIEAIEELSAGRAQRKAEKKMAKAEVKSYKQQNKPKNIRRAQAQTARQERKAVKLDKKQFMTGAERAATVGNIVKGATSITSAIVTKGGGGAGVPDFNNVPDYNSIPSVYTNTSQIPGYDNTQDEEIIYVEAEEVPNEDMGESLTWMFIKANKKPILKALGVITLLGVGSYVALKYKRS